MKRLVLAFVLPVAFAACQRHDEPGPVTTAAPAASTPAAAAEPAAPSGPVIAPVAMVAPTDIQRQQGATLATQGGNGVAACSSCHGANGEGNTATGFPRIAGQSFAYLRHELESYAAGGRQHPVMGPIATAMSADQRAAAAAHYASLAPSGTAPSGPTGAASAPTATATPVAARMPPAAGGRGRQLAESGDNALGVQACANCHGPGGIGAGELYPYLAGQHAAYLAAALGAWRDGPRNNDPSGQMPVVAKALSPDDITAVAAYYAAQAARATPIDAEAMPSTATQRTAVLSGPRAAASASGPPSSGGTEQGAGLTGGAQGPGGGGGTGSASNGQPVRSTAPQPAASR